MYRQEQKQEQKHHMAFERMDNVSSEDRDAWMRIRNDGDVQLHAEPTKEAQDAGLKYLPSSINNIRASQKPLADAF